MTEQFQGLVDNYPWLVYGTGALLLALVLFCWNSLIEWFKSGFSPQLALLLGARDTASEAVKAAEKALQAAHVASAWATKFGNETALKATSALYAEIQKAAQANAANANASANPSPPASK